MPKLILGYISFCTIFLTLYLYSILKESNILVAGFTLVLVIITAWYASISERQFKVTESGSKGKYIAELSRSIFSPMQIDLKRIRGYFLWGSFINDSFPIELKLFHIKHPKHYLEEDIEIIPAEAHDDKIDGLLVVRPAKALLKIQDAALKKHLFLLSPKLIVYQNSLDGINHSFDEISRKILPIWADFKTRCDELDGNHVIRILDAYNIVFRSIFERNVTIEQIDRYGSPAIGNLVHEGDNIYVLFNGERTNNQEENIVKILLFIKDHRDEIIRWVESSSINDEFQNYRREKGIFLTTIDEIIDLIDDLLLDWKVEYYLIENELYGKIKKISN